MNSSRHQCDVLIVGAGPAGLAAAWRVTQSGREATVVDDNPDPGGQIWRGEGKKLSSSQAAVWFDRIRNSSIRFINGARVYQHSGPGLLFAESEKEVFELSYEKAILATGARERFLPFPGWTLPNVMGAGGLQALVKGGLPVDEKRVVLAGSGPLLLAVADYLRRSGANILLIAEQSPWVKLARFGLSLLGQSSKRSQAFGLKRQLAGVKYLSGCWPIVASGQDKVESVTMRQGSRTWDVECDYLACGFHLVPNLELPQLLSCRIENGSVVVDDFQQTSIANIYCAGEGTGIGGLELSLVEGEIAGLAAAGHEQTARALFSARDKQRKFANTLNRAFELRSELKNLAMDETIVCRCEDVKVSQLKPSDSWRAAKLHTRCGMGPCQGRICGAAVEFLFGWKVESVRPPAFAVRVESMTQGSK